MKYLYIIRHAKAEASTNGQEDHDRNLINSRNRKSKKLIYWLKNVDT